MTAQYQEDNGEYSRKTLKKLTEILGNVDALECPQFEAALGRLSHEELLWLLKRLIGQRKDSRKYSDMLKVRDLMSLERKRAN